MQQAYTSQYRYRANTEARARFLQVPYVEITISLTPLQS